MTHLGVGDPLGVVEVKTRSVQGITRPFLCRASDGNLYWVKGQSAGYSALRCEWIAGRLGEEMGFPIPTFAQLTVAKSFVKESLFPEIGDLGSGLVFGSQDISETQEISILDARRILRTETTLARRVLLFDWWIQNEDRTMKEGRGNPNILVSGSQHKTVIIDHNLAFDPKWNESKFFQNHAFSECRGLLNPAELADIRDEMRALRKRVREFIGELPEDWENGKGVTIEPSEERIFGVLNRVESEWDRIWV